MAHRALIAAVAAPRFTVIGLRSKSQRLGRGDGRTGAFPLGQSEVTAMGWQARLPGCRDAFLR